MKTPHERELQDEVDWWKKTEFFTVLGFGTVLLVIAGAEMQSQQEEDSFKVNRRDITHKACPEPEQNEAEITLATADGLYRGRLVLDETGIPRAVQIGITPAEGEERLDESEAALAAVTAVQGLTKQTASLQAAQHVEIIGEAQEDGTVCLQIPFGNQAGN